MPPVHGLELYSDNLGITGTPAEARRAVAMGCYFSISAETLRSPKHRRLVADLPSDRLLTETDGPFVEADGRSVRPMDVPSAVDQLAVLRSTKTDTMARTIRANLRTLVSPYTSHGIDVLGKRRLGKLQFHLCQESRGTFRPASITIGV